MRKDMKRKIDRLVAPLGAVLCVFACFAGYERREVVPSSPPVPARKDVSRAHDTAYQAQVRAHDARNRRARAEYAKVLAQMERLRERARAALPDGATDEQVTAELEGNPQKYPAWRELGAARRRAEEAIERNRAAAQATVRRRVLREVSEQVPRTPSVVK